MLKQLLHISELDAWGMLGTGLLPVPGAASTGVELGVFKLARTILALHKQAAPTMLDYPWGLGNSVHINIVVQFGLK